MCLWNVSRSLRPFPLSSSLQSSTGGASWPRQASFSYFAILAMAFLLPLDLSNLQREVFSSQLKLKLPYFDQCSAGLEAAVLGTAYHTSCWLSETCLLIVLWFGSARPLPVRVSFSFQAPFDGVGNCTHWHLGLLCNFSKGKTCTFKGYNVLSVFLW